VEDIAGYRMFHAGALIDVNDFQCDRQTRDSAGGALKVYLGSRSLPMTTASSTSAHSCTVRPGRNGRPVTIVVSEVK
jgi:hypothetical protein